MSDNTPETTTTTTTPRAPMARRTKVLIGAGAAALLILGGTGIAFAATDGFEMDHDPRGNHSQSQDQLQDQAGGSTEQRNDRTDSDDTADTMDADDAPISDADRAKAEAAGLTAAGGTGTVTELERSDDLDHAWEVEVTFADGRDVDVELAADFSVTRVDKN